MLRLVVAKIRLLRKLGSTRDEDRCQTIDWAVHLLDNETLASLSQQPPLLREVTAELGKLQPDLFALALDVLGVDLPAGESPGAIGSALYAWDTRLSGNPDDSSELARRVGYQGEASPDGWTGFIQDFSEKELSSRIASWRGEMQPDPGVDAAVDDLYRESVEEALARREPSELE